MFKELYGYAKKIRLAYAIQYTYRKRIPLKIVRLYVLIGYKNKSGTKLCSFSVGKIPYLGYFYKKGHYPVLIYHICIIN